MEYGQFCPVAKAAEILGEKWSILILRELLYGSSRFNEFQRGIPGISPTMLTKRLKEFESAGLVTKHDHDYYLTASGQQLAPVLREYAVWGMRWARGKISESELNVELLMADMRRRIRTEYLPDAGCTIEVRFSDLSSAAARWWLLVKDETVNLSDEPPGVESDLVILSDLPTLTQMWMGDITLHTALARQRLTLKGLPQLIRTIEKWLPLASYANVRPAAITPSPA